MSEIDAQTAIPALEPVRVSLEVPGRLVRDYNQLVTAGLYMSVEEALRHGLVASWRFDHGLFHTVRVDVGGDAEAEADKADPEATRTPAS